MYVLHGVAYVYIYGPGLLIYFFSNVLWQYAACTVAPWRGNKYARKNRERVSGD